MAVKAGVIIDQRRLNRSATTPQTPLDRKTTALAIAIGVATNPGERWRSFWRCVANNAQIEY